MSFQRILLRGLTKSNKCCAELRHLRTEIISSQALPAIFLTRLKDHKSPNISTHNKSIRIQPTEPHHKKPNHQQNPPTQNPADSTSHFLHRTHPNNNTTHPTPKPQTPTFTHSLNQKSKTHP
ncbi:hypothetical protein KC19_9G179300 [Ceratodon purpureus]|uniref:Uncharacterized protein n=1 Tax=Ceratodon purpureus TaxID=3225 RepID=A0A8T0GT69_CERPU|nr:hypothetical protein KC19_9G179300 [Ceratodon purpureus]